MKILIKYIFTYYSLILKFLIIFKKYYKICNKNYLLFNFVKYKYKKTICTNI